MSAKVSKDMLTGKSEVMGGVCALSWAFRRGWHCSDKCADSFFFADSLFLNLVCALQENLQCLWKILQALQIFLNAL